MKASELREHFSNLQQAISQISDDTYEKIQAAAVVISEAFRKGGKLLICGNGGSAADAQHFAAEFVCRLRREFPRPPMPALALTTDTSFLTACANDFSFEMIFSRQVEALAKPEDVLLGISTSGSSTNVIEAFKAAQKIGCKRLALTSEGAEMVSAVDLAICVPKSKTAHIQEMHLAIEHMLCQWIEEELFEQS